MSDKPARTYSEIIDLELLRLTDETDFSVRRSSMLVSENILNQGRRKNPSSP
jgi:hypothetical protein